MQKLLQNDQCHLNYFYIYCVHACTLAHIPWRTCGGQRKTWGSWCCPPTMWVPGSNSGHQTWWQFPLSALRPNVMIKKVSMKCYFLQGTLHQFLPMPRKRGHKTTGALALYTGHSWQGFIALNFYIFCLPTVPWFQGLNLRWPQARQVQYHGYISHARQDLYPSYISHAKQVLYPELHPQTLGF